MEGEESEHENIAKKPSKSALSKIGDVNINMSPMRGNSDEEDPDFASESPNNIKGKDNSKSKMARHGNFLAAGRT